MGSKCTKQNKINTTDVTNNNNKSPCKEGDDNDEDEKELEDTRTWTQKKIDALKRHIPTKHGMIEVFLILILLCVHSWMVVTYTACRYFNTLCDFAPAYKH